MDSLEAKGTTWARALAAVLIAVAMAAAAAVYLLLDPEKTALMPRCGLYMLTGLRCPTCGLQRALHHGFNGNIAEAISYNYLLIIALPYLALCLLAAIPRHSRLAGRLSQWLRARLFSPAALKAALAIYCLWGIARNILGV